MRLNHLRPDRVNICVLNADARRPGRYQSTDNARITPAG